MPITEEWFRSSFIVCVPGLLRLITEMDDSRLGNVSYFDFLFRIALARSFGLGMGMRRFSVRPVPMCGSRGIV